VVPLDDAGPLLVLELGANLSIQQPCVGPLLVLAFLGTLGAGNGLVVLDTWTMSEVAGSKA